MVDVNFLPDHPRQRRDGEQIEMELPGMFQILYRGEDGSLQSTSARWEEKRTLPAADDTRVDIRLMADGQPQAISGPDGLELSVPLRLETTATSGSGIPMVTAIETGELQEPDPGRPSLILCRPGADGLWKLAKRCGSTVEAIEKANGIDGSASSDRMLLVPVS